MCEVSTVGQTETHESVLGLNQRRQGCKANDSQSDHVSPNDEQTRHTWQSRIWQSAQECRASNWHNRTYTSRIRLDVDAPFFGIEMERLQGPLAAEVFEFVDPLVTTVVPGPRKTLGILVGQDRAIGLDGSTAGQVLWRCA